MTTSTNQDGNYIVIPSTPPTKPKPRVKYRYVFGHLPADLEPDESEDHAIQIPKRRWWQIKRKPVNPKWRLRAALIKWSLQDDGEYSGEVMGYRRYWNLPRCVEIANRPVMDSTGYSCEVVVATKLISAKEAAALDRHSVVRLWLEKRLTFMLGRYEIVCEFSDQSFGGGHVPLRP